MFTFCPFFSREETACSREYNGSKVGGRNLGGDMLKLYPPDRKHPTYRVRGCYLGTKVDKSTGARDENIAKQFLAKWKADIEREALPDDMPDIAIVGPSPRGEKRKRKYRKIGIQRALLLPEDVDVALMKLADHRAQTWSELVRTVLVDHLVNHGLLDWKFIKASRPMRGWRKDPRSSRKRIHDERPPH
jgi:hypothetical protein